MGKIIYSIGHSTLPVGKLIKNLKSHRIKIVADCRSIPRSRFYPQYNQKALSLSLENTGIGYVWMGESLGGKLENTFHELGIKQLAVLAEKSRVAVLCSEGDYKKCHRHKVLEPEMKAVGFEMLHITRSGDIC